MLQVRRVWMKMKSVKPLEKHERIPLKKMMKKMRRKKMMIMVA